MRPIVHNEPPIGRPQTPPPALAACCADLSNRRTSTLSPEVAQAAQGGVPGLQLCSVCGRRHYTFTVTPQTELSAGARG